MRPLRVEKLEKLLRTKTSTPEIGRHFVRRAGRVGSNPKAVGLPSGYDVFQRWPVVDRLRFINRMGFCESELVGV